MGRKRRPETTHTRIRSRDLDRLRALARQSRISFPEFITRVTNQLQRRKR